MCDGWEAPTGQPEERVWESLYEEVRGGEETEGLGWWGPRQGPLWLP